MGFVRSDLGFAYSLCAWTTGEWVSDIAKERTPIEIYTQAQMTVRVLEEIYGE